MVLEYKANKMDTNMKVSSLIRREFNISSRLLTKLKMNEKIIVNDIPVFSNYIIKENDLIRIKIDFEEEDFIEAQDIPLNILFEDNYLLAVNKPSRNGSASICKSSK